MPDRGKRQRTSTGHGSDNDDFAVYVALMEKVGLHASLGTANQRRARAPYVRYAQPTLFKSCSSIPFKLIDFASHLVGL